MNDQEKINYLIRINSNQCKSDQNMVILRNKRLEAKSSQNRFSLIQPKNVDSPIKVSVVRSNLKQFKHQVNKLIERGPKTLFEYQFIEKNDPTVSTINNKKAQVLNVNQDEYLKNSPKKAVSEEKTLDNSLDCEQIDKLKLQNYNLRRKIKIQQSKFHQYKENYEQKINIIQKQKKKISEQLNKNILKSKKLEKSLQDQRKKNHSLSDQIKKLKNPKSDIKSTESFQSLSQLVQFSQKNLQKVLSQKSFILMKSIEQQIFFDTTKGIAIKNQVKKIIMSFMQNLQKQNKKCLLIYQDIIDMKNQVEYLRNDNIKKSILIKNSNEQKIKQGLQALNKKYQFHH